MSTPIRPRRQRVLTPAGKRLLEIQQQKKQKASTPKKQTVEIVELAFTDDLMSYQILVNTQGIRIWTSCDGMEAQVDEFVKNPAVFNDAVFMWQRDRIRLLGSNQ